jgi:hypothetical protein
MNYFHLQYGRAADRLGTGKTCQIYYLLTLAQPSGCDPMQDTFSVSRRPDEYGLAAIRVVYTSTNAVGEHRPMNQHKRVFYEQVTSVKGLFFVFPS